MRNDARPIGGERSHQSPVVSHESAVVGRPSSVVVHPSGIYRPRPEPPVGCEQPSIDFEVDELVMPSNDSTLNTKI